MPTIPTSQESPSVFDPLYEQLIKRFIGSGADVSDIAGLSGPLGIAAPLIAKAPLDIKTIRNIILKNGLNEINDATKQAVDFATKKYPRLTAHLLDVSEASPIEDVQVPGFETLALHSGLKPTHGWTSRIQIDPNAIQKLKSDQPFEEAVAESFGHELTHAGQYLWNMDKMGKRYKAANELLGYKNNPFEVGARRGGENFKNKMFYPAASKKLKKPEPVPQPAEGAIDRILRLFTGE